jgi:import inner membrane translocase subunit TIM23
MYYVVGSTMNLFFEDELANLNTLSKNMLCGAITGGIFKSTLGVVPCVVGTLVGGSLIGALSLLVT